MSRRSASCLQRLRPTPPRCRCRVTSFQWRPQRPPGALLCSSVGIAAAAVAHFAALRLCQTHSTASTAQSASAGAAAAAAASSTASSTPTRERFVCPECGKRFLCAANLLRHRSSRHGLHVVTPQEAARAKLAAKNAELERELTRLRARVQQLKEESPSAGTTSSTTNNAAPSVMTKAYPSAIFTGQLTEVDASLAREWQQSGVALGTGVSFVHCVGTVRGPVQLGTLAGAASASPATAPRVVQFKLETHGYRERRPGQLKMHRAHTLVRYIPAQPYHTEKHPRPSKLTAALFAVQAGDVVSVQGHYGLHNSYDMVSKRPVENAVIEADFVGLLRPAGAVEAATVVVTPSQNAPAVSKEDKEGEEGGLEPAEAMPEPAPSVNSEATASHAAVAATRAAERKGARCIEEAARPSRTHKRRSGLKKRAMQHRKS